MIVYLDIVSCDGNVVTVNFSPAPVMRGVEPEGNDEETIFPLVRCLSRVI